MKTKDIARNHGIGLDEFDIWLKKSSYTYKTGMLGGLDLDDSLNVDQIVSNFKLHLVQLDERIRQVKADIERAAQEKQQALASMLITSGFNFDGYTITKYSGYISGDDAVQSDRPTKGWLGGMSSNVAEDLLANLAKIRRNALAELKESAYALGCNAVIGVDFDYLTLDPETVTPQGGTLYLPFLFAVTANGNAVVIEKNGRSALG
ncbi:MAG: heavy metal-binding domain-containing protein [Rhodoferax sp.]|nr:heavy metal-binding domain-containing protein [Rhodoferax sp.]